MKLVDWWHWSIGGSARPNSASSREVLARQSSASSGEVLARPSSASNREILARPSSASSRDVLEAFYYGRALAEVLSEQLGTAVIDFLSQLGQRDAEQRRFLRQACPYPVSSHSRTCLGKPSSASIDCILPCCVCND